jgi:hypothetical protein
MLPNICGQLDRLFGWRIDQNGKRHGKGNGILGDGLIGID